jgi:hypothetical protein
VAIALAMDEATRTQMEPHYQLACQQDADRIKLHTALLDGGEPDPAAAAARDFIINGLLPASRVDADVFRAFFRSFNMLDDPRALLEDPVVLTAAANAHATKDERPPLPTLGPPRQELLAVMGTAAS